MLKLNAKDVLVEAGYPNILLPSIGAISFYLSLVAVKLHFYSGQELFFFGF